MPLRMVVELQVAKLLPPLEYERHTEYNLPAWHQTELFRNLFGIAPSTIHANMRVPPMIWFVTQWSKGIWRRSLFSFHCHYLRTSLQVHAPAYRQSIPEPTQ